MVRISLKLRSLLTLAVLISSVLVFTQASSADALKASLATMPLSAEVDSNGNFKGAYVDLIHAIDRLTGTSTHIVVTPFKRSIRNLVTGDADYHIPFIEPPNTDRSKLPYAFSTETLFQVAFVLYTNKERTLDTNNLAKYKIATELAHVSFFPFPASGLSCLSCGLKMVESGRIDGFIFAQNEMDPFISKLGLKKIRRQLYKNFNVKILIPRNKKGKDIDHYFTSGIQTLRAQGVYDHLLAPLLMPYKDWQP